MSENDTGAERAKPDASASPDTPPRRTRTRKATTTSAAADDQAVTTAAPGESPAGSAASAPTDPSGTRKTSAKKTTAKRATVKKATAKKATAKRATAKRATAKSSAVPTTAEVLGARKTGAKKTAAKKTGAKKTGAGQAASSTAELAEATPTDDTTPPEAVAPSRSASNLFVAPEPGATPAGDDDARPTRRQRAARSATAAPLFHEPDPTAPPAAPAAEQTTPASPRPSTRSAARRSSAAVPPGDTPRADTEPAASRADAAATAEAPAGAVPDVATESGTETTSSSRRRRRRGGRGRKRSSSTGADTEAGAEGADSAGAATDGSTGAVDAGRPAETTDSAAGTAATTTEDAGTTDTAAAEATDTAATTTEGTSSSSRRRRSRRRAGSTTSAPAPDDPPQTVVRVRESRPSTDEDVTSVKGSTRLEAKKQRRRDGRDSGRRRTPIVSESEFLARRESVERVMVVRQVGSRTQIGVLEDGVLVEHYVAQASQTSSVGNVYLGKVQNVLPAMEAAFIDIGKGRNAVLYAGEVAWARMGMENGKPRRMESVLSSGQSVLVQVTKDPVGHKGARLTGLVSLPGRFLVYAPGGSMSGISRKLPEEERNRLKGIVKKVFPDEASVIIRTAAEGASEDELSKDIHRLESQWLDIEAKAKSSTAPARLYAEPDLAIKVLRDMFNEDFARLVISGDEAWGTLHTYVTQVAPDLVDRLVHWTSDTDVFAEHGIDDQIAKALDRKVWLPSGGSLVIDRTEAMTVVDVNTGKFTGSGGNLEATVTKNNLEAAEEIVRQIRLRDIGGIIVIDFIDMVLESNRDLVLRRLVECLGRDRTRHQVAEVTSLGLVQMTRKRVGQGLLDVFSEPCEHCNGRGLKIHYEPVDHGDAGGQHDPSQPRPSSGGDERPPRAARSSRSGRRDSAATDVETSGRPGPAEVIRAVAKAAVNAHRADEVTSDGGEAAVGLPAAAEASQDSSAAMAADTTAALDTVEVFTVSGDTAAATDATHPVEAAAESPAPRGRRTRSTRRPAGPPRPATAGSRDGPTTDGPTTDGPTTDGPTIDRRTTDGASSAQPARPQQSSQPSTIQPPITQAPDGSSPDGQSTHGQSDAESATSAPRRRRGRATRPAGAPMS